MTALDTRPPLRRDIQGLRALAVIAVVLDHALGWPRGGYAGVDVFFVISGFLITGMLLRELAATGRLSLRAFFVRRIRRLLPASLLVLVAVVAAGFLVFHAARAERTLWDAVSALLLVSNLRFAAEGTDYFRAGDAVSPLQHFWSLSVEEQFSLAWPLLVVALVLLVPRGSRARVGAVVVAIAGILLAAASFAWGMTDTAASPLTAYFSTASRAWELLLGGVIAAATPLLSRLPAAVRWPLGWIGAAGVVASFVLIDAQTPFPVPGAVLPVGAAALVLAAGVGGDPRARHLFPITNPLTTAVGDMSYSLYLWHFPVIVFAAVLLPPGPVAVALVLGSIAVLTLVSYFGIEQPFRRAPSRNAAPATSAVLAPVEDPPAPEVEPARVRLTSRPEGWVPGVRYYPGARPRAVEAGAVDADTIAEPAAAPVVPIAVAHPAGAGAASPPEPPEAESASPWALWRRRFGAQIGLSATGLVFGAGLIAVVVFATYGGPVLGPTAAPEPEAAAEDPTAALQAELAAALGSSAWPQLHPSLDDAMRTSSSDNPAHDCFAPEVALDAARCTWGSPDAPRHMFLVGDSTAMAYAPAFRRIAEDSGGVWRVTTVGMYGCRFTDVLVQTDDPAVMAGCAQRKLDVRAAAAADPGELVVVANAYTLGHTVDGRDLDAAALAAAARAEVASYAAPGHLVLLDAPPHGADLDRCYSPVGTPASCTAAIDPVWTDMQAASARTAAESGDHSIDALPFTCWEGVCPAFAGDLPLRYDANHLTVAYAEHIAAYLRWALDSRGLL